MEEGALLSEVWSLHSPVAQSVNNVTRTEFCNQPGTSAGHVPAANGAFSDDVRGSPLRRSLFGVPKIKADGE